MTADRWRTPPRQRPIGSGFGPTTTAEAVLAKRNLTGATAIVTGGYAGLGLETTRALAQAGADVVVPARSPERARAALRALPGVQQERLDLSRPTSIDAFAQRFLQRGRALDILVNNAGIMAPPLTRDARGYESQLATNHLGHFQLTARLWPALRQADGARVVSLSSLGHRIGPVDFDDPNFERREYDKWVAYGQSKSANALFAVGLDARGGPHGVHAFSVQPGGIITDLARYLDRAELQAMGAIDERGQPRSENLKTIEQGAATTVWCATSPQLDGQGGVYCEDVDIAEAVSTDSDRASGVRPWAIDHVAAERLWTLSEELTGVSF
jgi:NAD(P)-dependent dehydrogenase (short-subunit alcohol dehydrogenase family)